jgi:hypothetical protein
MVIGCNTFLGCVSRRCAIHSPDHRAICCVSGTIQARDVLQASLTAAAPAALEPEGPADAAPVAAAPTATEAAAADPEPAAATQPAPAAAAAGAAAAAEPAGPAATATAAGAGAAAGAAAATPAAPPKPAPKVEEPEWVQADGFVPVPRAAPTEAPKGTVGTALDVEEEEPALPPARPAPLPAANSWAIADEAEEEDSNAGDVADVFADPRMAPRAAGDTPVVSAQSALGGDMPTGGALGAAGAAPATDIFQAGTFNELPNTYKPSPMNALSANDLLVRLLKT